MIDGARGLRGDAADLFSEASPRTPLLDPGFRMRRNSLVRVTVERMNERRRYITSDYERRESCPPRLIVTSVRYRDAALSDTALFIWS